MSNPFFYAGAVQIVPYWQFALRQSRCVSSYPALWHVFKSCRYQTEIMMLQVKLPLLKVKSSLTQNPSSSPSEAQTGCRCLVVGNLII